MRQLLWLLGGTLLVSWTVGCEPANRYHAGRTEPERRPVVTQLPPPQPAAPEPLDAGLAWLYPTPSLIMPSARIEFVNAADQPEEWARLTHFWNAEAFNPAVIGLPPLPAAITAAAQQQAGQVIKIKVPLGLDDPSPHIPPSNPPTAAKWALGKKLFFDDSWLLAGEKASCASCHDPSRGFTRLQYDQSGLDTPTLLNTTFNYALFWDGRAQSLEEVLQRTLEDERPPATAGSAARHVWSGVVERLRANATYTDAFSKAFGTRPTADAAGKALATYMRTLLNGDSLHDQAMRAARQRKAQAPEAADYDKLLTEPALQALEWEAGKKAEGAQKLAAGYRLFTGKARCVLCHSGANYTDSNFHNVGIGESAILPPPGRETGRFVALPIGLKDANMIGAYRTPTLRALLQKDRYFHDGTPGLFGAVLLHARGPVMNPYLDPLLRDPADANKPRDLGLNEDDYLALVLFLRSLDGQPVPAVISDPKQQPEAVPSFGP